MTYSIADKRFPEIPRGVSRLLCCNVNFSGCNLPASDTGLASTVNTLLWQYWIRAVVAVSWALFASLLSLWNVEEGLPGKGGWRLHLSLRLAGRASAIIYLSGHWGEQGYLVLGRPTFLSQVVWRNLYLWVALLFTVSLKCHSQRI